MIVLTNHELEWIYLIYKGGILVEILAILGYGALCYFIGYVVGTGEGYRNGFKDGEESEKLKNINKKRKKAVLNNE